MSFQFILYIFSLIFLMISLIKYFKVYIIENNLKIKNFYNEIYYLFF
jgi:hypothetical protein